MPSDPLGVNLDLCLRCKVKVGVGFAALYCQACQDAEDYLEDDSIRCPFCLHIHKDEIWEFVSYDSENWEMDCHECGKEFEVETQVTYTFRSPPKGKKELD